MHTPGDEDGFRNMRTSKELLHLEQETPLYGTQLLVGNSKASSNPVPRKRSSTFTSKIESSVLSRVKAFLPTLESENTKIFSQIEKGGGDFDIEVLTGGENMPHVEMDLALRVADLQTPEAVAAAELAVCGSGPVCLQDLSSGDSDIDDGDNEGADSEDDHCGGTFNVLEEGRGCRGADAVGPL